MPAGAQPATACMHAPHGRKTMNSSPIRLLLVEDNEADAVLLKEALAEMNTETFMFSKNDRSVVLK